MENVAKNAYFGAQGNTINVVYGLDMGRVQYKEFRLSDGIFLTSLGTTLDDFKTRCTSVVPTEEVKRLVYETRTPLSISLLEEQVFVNARNDQLTGAD
ncbi:MAG: hypothetical protein WCK29_02255 [archaeon]